MWRRGAQMRNSVLLLILANICLGMWLYSSESKRMAERTLPPENPQISKLLLLSELAKPLQPNKSRKAVKRTVPKQVPPPKKVVTKPTVEKPKPVMVESSLPLDPAPVLLCYTYGPFTEASKTRRAARLFKDAGVSVNRRSSQEQEPYGYRVFIPPLPNRQRAYAVASELRTNGVKDYFVITNPSDKLDGISLGLFSQKTGALKRVAQMRNLGYQANIEIRYKDKEIFWLDYQAQEGQVTQEVFNEAGEGVNGIQLLTSECS